MCANFPADAAPIVGPGDFTFTSATGPAPSNGDPAFTADGDISNPTFFPGASGVQYRGAPPVGLTYSFTQLYDVSGFVLHNGWDIQNQAVNAFNLTFFDPSSAQIGQVFNANGSPGVGVDQFDLGFTYLNVASVVLEITSTHAGEVEFREIAFDGTVVPEPSTSFLAALGLVAVGVSSTLKLCNSRGP